MTERAGGSAQQDDERALEALERIFDHLTTGGRRVCAADYALIRAALLRSSGQPAPHR